MLPAEILCQSCYEFTGRVFETHTLFRAYTSLLLVPLVVNAAKLILLRVGVEQ
jgi:hypothetical protein